MGNSNVDIDYTNIARESNKILNNESILLDDYLTKLDNITKLLVDIEGNFKVGMENYIQNQKININNCKNEIINIRKISTNNAIKLDSEKGN